jgi:hypothetical protein
MVVLQPHPVLTSALFTLRKLTGDSNPRPGLFLPAILAGRAEAFAGGAAARAAWSGVLLSFFMLLRAEHMWAYADGLVSEGAAIMVGDVAFAYGGGPVTMRAVRAGAPVDAAFITLRGSKVDQTQRGEVVPLLPGAGGPGDALAVLAACVRALPAAAGPQQPLMTYQGAGGTLRAVTRGVATALVRQLARYQATAEEAALFGTHAMRVGGATTLAHAGVPAEDIKRAGRWRSNAYVVYIRANMADFIRIQAALRGSARKGPQLVPAVRRRQQCSPKPRRTWT